MPLWTGSRSHLRVSPPRLAYVFAGELGYEGAESV